MKQIFLKLGLFAVVLSAFSLSFTSPALGGKTLPLGPVIDSLQPSSGPVGTVVTITGSGFTPTGNTIHFAEGGMSGVNSSNGGTTLTFEVPYWISSCQFKSPALGFCNPPARLVTPGDYTVYVVDGNGQSNSMTFTVTSSSTLSLPPPTK